MRLPRSPLLCLALTLAALAQLGIAPAVAPPALTQARLEKQRCPKPAEFASAFSFGYAADSMPQPDDRFERLLRTIKEGGFNTIHCTHTDRRLALCKKHRIQMMIDLLAAPHHVYRNPDKARALCLKLRDNPDVWGYNIWNDTFGHRGGGRRRDINAVRRWDPTHPAYCGTYRTHGMRDLVNADVLGYYDFHWKRGTGQHFPHLLAYRNWARQRNAWFYAWLATGSGRPGKGNFNRCLYSANTSIACGLKGVLWFLGTALLDRETLKWTATGQDIVKVNKEIMPLRRELARVGNPSAVCSTPVRRTLNDRPLPDGKKAMLPPGLERNAFPKGFWLQPMSGEFLLGAFRDGKKRDVVFLANHNAYAAQKVALKLALPLRAEWFNRKEGTWQALKGKGGVIRLGLAPAGGELLRFQD
jgi:hypothetical protein